MNNPVYKMMITNARNYIAKQSHKKDQNGNLIISNNDTNYNAFDFAEVLSILLAKDTTDIMNDLIKGESNG